MTAKNTWICENEKVLISSPVLDIVQRDCRSSEDGDKSHRFYLMRSRDWCNIIPITRDGKVVMVRQYRIGISAHTLEVPGGVTDPTDTDPKAAAVREMTEETGYAPIPGARCEELGQCWANPAILDNHVHSYVIGPVERVGGQNLDAGEMIDVVEVPIEEIPARILNGEIGHSLMLVTFFYLGLRSELGAQALREQLAKFTQI